MAASFIVRVSVPLPGFSGLRPDQFNEEENLDDVSVPLPGFSGLRPFDSYTIGEQIDIVSVPLPGFSGLRPSQRSPGNGTFSSFSPVAGIQWVETFVTDAQRTVLSKFQSRCRDSVG